MATQKPENENQTILRVFFLHQCGQTIKIQSLCFFSCWIMQKSHLNLLNELSTNSQHKLHENICFCLNYVYIIFCSIAECSISFFFNWLLSSLGCIQIFSEVKVTIQQCKILYYKYISNACLSKSKQHSITVVAGLAVRTLFIVRQFNL